MTPTSKGRFQRRRHYAKKRNCLVFFKNVSINSKKNTITEKDTVIFNKKFV